MLFEEVNGLKHEPALKLLFILETKFFHTRLALRAVLPANLGRFVAADVEISAGEELNHLAEHIKDELQRIVVPAQSISSKMPCFVPTSRGLPLQESSG